MAHEHIPKYGKNQPKLMPIGLILFAAYALGACKPQPLDSNPLGTPSSSGSSLRNSSSKHLTECAIKNPSPLMNRLTSFTYNGVIPYLSCPYQSEWSVYPYYFLIGDRLGGGREKSPSENSFHRWMVDTFRSLETKSALTNPQLFTNRYEFYTVVMGEGLALHFDLATEENTDGSFSEALNGAAEIQPSNPGSKPSPDLNPGVGGAGKEGILTSDQPKKLQLDPTKDLKVRGFGILGTDWFGAEFPNLKNKPYAKPYIGDFVLNKHFEYSKEDNERGESVLSADFQNLDTGLNAFAAIYIERRQMYLEDSKSCLGKLSSDEDIKMYWTYYYYRRPAEAKSKLCAGGGKIPTARSDEDGEHPKTISIQCLKRLATKKFLQQEKVLD